MIIVPPLPIIKKWNKTDVSIFPPTDCTALVVYNGRGNLGSTVGLPKFTKFLRDSTYIDSLSLGVMIGILIGDACFNKKAGPAKRVNNVRISFKQSINNFPFLWTVFIALSHYIPSLPRLDYTTIRGVKYTGVQFETRLLPCITILYDKFMEHGRKSIPVDIYYYLSPVALAYWIMSDGARYGKGMVLCTDGFTVVEVVRLMNVLIYRYEINCSLIYSAVLPRIYIRADNMDKLRSIVVPYMIPFSMYKLSGKVKGKSF